MAIVVDINCIPCVFDSGNALHSEFIPVLNFVISGDGFLIYGGSSYKKELERLDRYRRLIVALRKGGRAIAINDDAVDKLEESVKGKIRGTDCDDPHIIALLAAANCALLCSSDKRSFRFIQDRAFYSKANSRVKIYTSSRNKDLLVRQKSRIWNIDK